MSPKVLLQPDQPPTEEVLTVVGEKLLDLPDDDLEEEEGIVIGDPNSQDNQADLPVVDEAASMVDFDSKKAMDQEDCSSKVLTSRDSERSQISPQAWPDCSG